METEAGAQSLSPTEWNEEPSRGRTYRSCPLKGRDEVLGELRGIVLNPSPIFIRGPRGAGTSALAREYVSELRARLDGRNPVVIRVDVSAQNCPGGDPSYGVATSLLRHFQPDAPVKGASRARIMWWFLRRVLAEGRPVIVWLDQLRPTIRSLGSVMGPLLNPGTLLGDGGELPKVFLVLSGCGDFGLNGSVKRIQVPALSVGPIHEILEDWTRQTGRFWDPVTLQKVKDIFATRGNSLSVMEEVLKAAVQRAGCHVIITEGDVIPPAAKGKPRANMHNVDLCVLEALRRAGGKMSTGQLSQELAKGFLQAGEPKPTDSSIRRWMVRMQRLGMVERRVKMGGDGGTRSVVSITVPSASPSSLR